MILPVIPTAGGWWTLPVPILCLQVALCSEERNFSVAHLIINYSTVPWQLLLAAAVTDAAADG